MNEFPLWKVQTHFGVATMGCNLHIGDIGRLLIKAETIEINPSY